MLSTTTARRRHAIPLHPTECRAGHFDSSDYIADAASTQHRFSLDWLFTKIARLATLPLIAEQILRLSLELRADTSGLVEVIKSDPAMTASILRRVNSSYFGMTQKVNGLERAAILLGGLELRNLALTVVVKRMFDRPATYGSYDREALWRHSMAVAATARKIARVTGSVPQHDAYIAGLLHHVGTLCIDLHMRTNFCTLIEQLQDDRPSYCQEREILLFDQAQLGAHVTRSWHFPNRITDAIHYHEIPLEYAGEHEKLVYIVSVADYLCSRAGMTAMGVFNTRPPEDRAYAVLGVDRVALAIIWEDLLNHLADAASF